jgi:basic membrane protein A and related proteins
MAVGVMQRGGWTRLLVRAIVAALVLVAASIGSAPASGEQNGTRVVLVTRSCTSAGFLCPAFKRALLRTGMSGRIISPDLREDPVGTLSLLARQGYDVVVVDITFADPLAIVAPRFPKTRFVLFDASLSSLKGHPRNVEGIVLLPHEGAYLAGWLAARMEQRRRGPAVVGIVAGLRTPEVLDFIVGFRAGAHAADAGIIVLTGYSHDFVDPDKCHAIAESEIARRAGVVFNVAGLCGLGTLRATESAGVWGIGVDTDQAFLGRHILTSVLKGYEAGFIDLLGQVRRGAVRTGLTRALTLRDGGSSLGRISPEVPASLRSALNRVRRKILAGEIRVPLASPA